MNGQLHFLNGPLAGQVVQLPPVKGIVIGRADHCEIPVRVKGVSRTHCQIDFDGEDYQLSDLGSSNGTYVNRKRIEHHRLGPGDRIRLGTVKIDFQFGQADATTTATQKISGATSDTDTSVLYLCDLCGTSVDLEATDSEAAAHFEGQIYCERCREAASFLGRQLGQYQIAEMIAHGGMGTVFRAEHEMLDRTVALKVLRKDLCVDGAAIYRFVRGARVGAQLVHPNIAQLYDVGESGGAYYIAMEYIEGPTVFKVLQSLGFNDVTQVLDVGIQIAQALAHAFEKRIVHRDVKPSNIMLAAPGVAKLTDLGIAKFMDEAGISSITESGACMGTADYMSPEHISDVRLVDHRGDIYSLGATLYHMLAGQPPFPARNIMAKLRQVRSAPPPSASRRNSKVPMALSAAIQKMMAKDPKNRFQTPQELLRALDAIRQDLAGGVPC